MDPLPAPRLGSRDLFPTLQARAYLSHAAISPVSLLVQRAATQAMEDFSAWGVGAFPLWAKQRQELRAALGRLIGAAPEDIALTPGTTHSISQLAFSLDWQEGDRLVIFQGEFPANVTPWQMAAKHFGLELLALPLPPNTSSGAPSDPAGELLDRLEATLRREAIRLVAVSAVQFQTGFRMPLAAMGRLCRTYGAELAVDGIQACGAVPLDVETQHIDYLSCGAHKWLMGLEGAGFTYVRPGLAPRLVPRLAGWLSHTDAEAFLFQGPGHLRYDRPLKTSAAVLEGSSTNVVGMAALQAAVSTLLQLGVTDIFEHVQAYLDALEPELEALGCRSLRARKPESRSCILSVRLPEGVDGAAVVTHLRDARIPVSYPDGLLRFSPHFPNSLTEVSAVASELRHALHGAP
jgi:cysteine desulfurase / selenocysteine lyase